MHSVERRSFSEFCILLHDGLTEPLFLGRTLGHLALVISFILSSSEVSDMQVVTCEHPWLMGFEV